MKKMFGIVVAILLLASCSAKATERFNDAGVDHKNDDPAVIYSMPDGFSNFASKCDEHGNRVFVAFKGDDNRAAIAVVPQDPSC